MPSKDGSVAQYIEDILAERNRYEKALKDVEEHLIAIAESSCEMGDADIVQLIMARGVIDAALLPDEGLADG